MEKCVKVYGKMFAAIRELTCCQIHIYIIYIYIYMYEIHTYIPTIYVRTIYSK